MSDDKAVANYDSKDPSQHELEIFYARRAGFSVTEIADRFQITVDEVIWCYNSYRKKMGATTLEASKEAAKALELARLDDLQKTYYEDARSGDKAALDAVLKIMQHRAKLQQMDQADPSDNGTRQNILIIGQSKEEFLDALREGRGIALPEKMDDEEATDDLK